MLCYKYPHLLVPSSNTRTLRIISNLLHIYHWTSQYLDPSFKRSWPWLFQFLLDIIRRCYRSRRDGRVKLIAAWRVANEWCWLVGGGGSASFDIVAHCMVMMLAECAEIMIFATTATAINGQSVPRHSANACLSEFFLNLFSWWLGSLMHAGCRQTTYQDTGRVGAPTRESDFDRKLLVTKRVYFVILRVFLADLYLIFKVSGPMRGRQQESTKSARSR